MNLKLTHKADQFVAEAYENCIRDALNARIASTPMTLPDFADEEKIKM